MALLGPVAPQAAKEGLQVGEDGGELRAARRGARQHGDGEDGVGGGVDEEALARPVVAGEGEGAAVRAAAGGAVVLCGADNAVRLPDLRPGEGCERFSQVFCTITDTAAPSACNRTASADFRDDRTCLIWPTALKVLRVVTSTSTARAA